MTPDEMRELEQGTRESAEAPAAGSQTVVVSIGRNVGSEPMDRTRWTNACHALYDVARIYASLGENKRPEVYFDGEGVGFSPEWGTEDAYTVVFGMSRKDRASRDYAFSLRAALAAIARRFDQDAIALTFGDTEFVPREGR